MLRSSTKNGQGKTVELMLDWVARRGRTARELSLESARRNAAKDVASFCERHPVSTCERRQLLKLLEEGNVSTLEEGLRQLREQ